MRKPCWIMVGVGIFSLVPAGMFAKRAVPKPVVPVVFNGVTYSAPNDRRGAYVVATDEKNGRKLWEVKVFETKYDSQLEEDVQDVWITELHISNDSLLVKDEKSRCYRVNLATHVAKRQYWSSCR